MPNSRERQERYQRLQQRRNVQMSSQPTSREVSPTPRRIPGGSNPDVREAVQMMVTEVTMFDQIMEKINSLVAEVWEYQEQNDARLQRHKEAFEHRMQEGTLDQEHWRNATGSWRRPAFNYAAPVPVVHTREQEIQELRRQLEERNRELTEARQRLQGSGVAPAPMECAQDREIQELRRQLQQRDQELAEVRRLAPSVQHTMTRCQDHHQQPPVINGSHSPQPLPRSRPHTPIPEQQLYPERRHTYDPQTSLPQQFRPRSSPQRPQSAHPSSQLSGTPFSYVFTKETVPHFKGDTSASQPLKKNQAIESWIRTIENIVKPATSEMFIQAARANCRGPAELIINSPLFDSITEWDTFKAALRSKFQGTYTSSDFYKVLYDMRMTPSQAPMDFFLQLEGHVYQGYRDHREAIGDPSELVKRVFLSGIPAWLQDFLSVKEDGSPTQIAETAQRIWNSRNGIRHSDTSAEENPYHPNRPPRGRDLYAMPVVAERSSPPYHRSPVRERWCEHRVRTHGTSECRARAETLDPQSPRRRCYHCRGPGHLVRDCPFRERQGDQAPGTAGRFDPRSTSRGDVTSQEGNGSDRAYRTASCGTQYLEMHHTVTVCDVRFPGDILLGMDFLRRTTFNLSSRSQDDSACLTLEGQEFHVNYTDAQSLQLSVVRVTTPEVPVNAEESRFSRVHLPLCTFTELQSFHHTMCVSWRV
ncbi:hypothetical protein C7M84_004315 [Penaeus vannamei]|uniref:CCHC-type domain-containing protein n=1 Tax=Penaeus vannamei TaxID=6689 RepID=A0A3R7QT08_PENVA|nr:hypothetical protein C7M84_004315 [Penaeus vannamei]